jgi:hypothetical protein
MSATHDGDRPLVAVVCAVPLLGAAMTSALEFAEVHSFAARGGDIAGLLHWLHPDAVIVDNDASAADATAFAQKHDLPVVHIALRERALRLFRSGEWEVVTNGEGPTSEAIRNVVAGVLFARGAPA